MPSAPVDLAARRARCEQAVARMAAAPVRHVPPAFLLALTCGQPAGDAGRWPVLRLAR